MLKITKSVFISRPVEEVFEYVSHPESHHHWQQGLIEVDSGGQKGPGTRVREVRKFIGRQVEFHLDTTEHVDNRLVRTRGHSEHVAIERVLRFDPEDGGTRVTLEYEMDTRGVFGDAKPIVERMIGREIEHSLNHLKELLEAHEHLHSAASKLPPHRHK